MEPRKTIWEQLVDRKSEFIGKRLQDFGDSMDRSMGLAGEGGETTIIEDLQYQQEASYNCFEVVGKDFTCSFNTKYGGVGGGEPGWLTFYGYGGHKWRIET